jgi:Glycosyltransferase family 87
MPGMPPTASPNPAPAASAGSTPTVTGGNWRTVPGLRVFAAWGADTSLRVAALVALALAVVWVVVNARPWAMDPMAFILDTSNYYAAAERLNAGHSLYAYSPGDRHVLALLFGLPSPYLYPPLMGVLWRPVAAFLPFEPVIIAWWAAGMASLLGFLVWLVWRGGRATAAGCLVLLVPLAITAWSGNVGSFITIAIVGAWLLLQRGHERTAGAIIGFTTVLKLSPVFLGWWLLATRRWNALAAAIAVGFASLAVSVAGAGLAAHVDFLRVGDAAARGGGIQGSIVGILSAFGTSSDVLALVAPVVSVVGMAAVWRLRDHERAAWAVAIATGVFASPIFNLTNVTVLLAAFVAFDGRLTARGEPQTAPVPS